MFRFVPIQGAALALSLLLAAAPLAAQGYSLHPGDVVIADTRQHDVSTGAGWVRVLRSDGAVETIASGVPLYAPTDVYIDRDGAVLVSSWRWQSAVENGIYRIDPATGALDKLNNGASGILHDNFQMARDGDGGLVVADGFMGLGRLQPDGSVDYFSPPSYRSDPSIGILLDYDHRLVVSESPNFLFGSPEPGKIFHVDPVTGARSLLVSDRSVLATPNGIALDRDGTYLAADSDPTDITRHGIVRIDRSGALQQIAYQSLAAPRDVEIGPKGAYLISDTGLEAVLARLPGGAVRTLVSEGDDGIPTNGLPVDRPFGIAMVPLLWLTTPAEVRLQETVRVDVRTTRSLAGREVVLAVSRFPGPSPLAAWWTGDVQTSHVDLGRAQLYRALVDSSGRASFVATVPADPALAGSALQLQAFEATRRWLSNPVALPVR